MIAGIVRTVPASGQDTTNNPQTNLIINCPAGVEPTIDFDADCVDDTLEREGYDKDLMPCTPGPDAPGCFVTDPTTWSSDGDPYSDFQEATGVNMDGVVERPYNGPLVAAMPRIEVMLLKYRFTPKATITDSQGREISSSSTQEWSVEATVGVSYTTSAEVSLTGGAKASASTTVSASVTAGYSSSQTQGESINWESATTTEADNAASLALDIAARNVGSATALNVTPTFNLFIGDEPLGTIVPDIPFPQDLLPDGELSDFITVDRRQKGNTNEEITLSIDQLRSLQRGAPIKIQVIGLDAGISRWRPEDSNWSCPDPCRWEEFQNQIEARTTRVLMDFGYSGIPEADIPREFVGNPFEYRVFTGSPNADPNFTLRDILRFTDNLQGNASSIRDRLYPSEWYITSGPERTRQDSSFFDYWEAAGEPDNVLDMVMPRSTAVLMASPDPLDPGPLVANSLITRSMRRAFVVATPKGSIPVAGGNAHLSFLGGHEMVVPLERIGETSFFATPDSLSLPIAPASSYFIVRDVLGSERKVGPGLSVSIPIEPNCTNISPVYYQEPRFGNTDVGTRDGVSTVFIGGDLTKPATAYCINDGRIIDFWVPQVNDMGLDDVFGVAVLDIDRRVAVGDNAILYSENGGLSWDRVPLATEDQTSFRAVAFREGTETGIAVGDESTFMRTEDGGRTWTRSTVENPGGLFVAVDYAGGDTWYATGGGRIRRSDDDGRSWVVASLEVVDSNGNAISRPEAGDLTAVDFVNKQVGVIGDGLMGDGEGRIYVTKDGGETWVHSLNYDRHQDFQVINDTTLIAVGRNAIVKDDYFADGDNARLVYSGPLDRVIKAVHFPTPEIGYAVMESGPVLRTDDGGETWDAPFGGYPTPTHPGNNFMQDIHMLDANIGAVVGTDGVIGMTDSGGGEPVTISNPVGTATEDPANTELPSQITLDQNYPNPFNPVTRIQYSLPEQHDVRLEVFDILGRSVALLVNESRNAGTHTVPFDAAGLSSGVYIYRITAGPHSVVRRMMLMK